MTDLDLSTLFQLATGASFATGAITGYLLCRLTNRKAP